MRRGLKASLPLSPWRWLIRTGCARLRALPIGEHHGRELGIPADCKLLLTVSLAEAHTDGFCYKLAANVVLIPATWREYFGPHAAGAAAG